jgi:hypothetical protein
MTVRWSTLTIGSLFGASLTPALAAAPDVLRDVDGRVGPVVARRRRARTSRKAGSRRLSTNSARPFASRHPMTAHATRLEGSLSTSGVIVTQGVPAASGYSGLVLDYKNALAKYDPGEAPDYTSLEGCIAATILIQAPKQTNPPIPNGWSTRSNRCAASISARHSHSDAQSTRPLTRSGTLRATRTARTSQSNLSRLSFKENNWLKTTH